MTTTTMVIGEPTDELIGLLLGQLHPSALDKNSSKLLRVNVSIAIFVEHLKGLFEVVFWVNLLPQLNLVGHVCEELVQLDSALPVRVHVLQQVLHLVVRWKHSNGSHEVAQLCTRD